MHAHLLTNRSFSDGAAEMAPKTVSSWSSNALDGPGLFDIDAPDDDLRRARGRHPRKEVLRPVADA